MSYSDEESEHDAAEGAAGAGDDKLKEYWSKKGRRRSSVFKAPVGDRLGLQDNSKMQLLLAKNGKWPDRVQSGTLARVRAPPTSH